MYPKLYFHSYQSNRKQSMNYGCIVENEETNEVFNPSHLISRNSQPSLFHLEIMTVPLFLRSCIM